MTKVSNTSENQSEPSGHNGVQLQNLLTLNNLESFWQLRDKDVPQSSSGFDKLTCSPGNPCGVVSWTGCSVWLCGGCCCQCVCNQSTVFPLSVGTAAVAAGRGDWWSTGTQANRKQYAQAFLIKAPITSTHVAPPTLASLISTPSTAHLDHD